MDQDPASTSKWFFSRLGLVILGVLIALGITFVAYALFLDDGSDTGSSSSSEAYDFGGCNAVGIELRGCLTTYYPTTPGSDGVETGCDAITASDELITILEEAKNDSNIKALILDVDSPGGTIMSGEEIASAVADFGKPSVAWIRSMGASAAYWAVSPSDIIVASANSDIGSIGVTLSYVDNAKQNSKEGLTYNLLSTGKYKNIGDPDKELTQDERNLLERDLYISRDNFIDAVAKYRDLPREKVADMADGSTIMGKVAKEKGLIDIVGGKKEAWEGLARLMGEEPRICWPQYSTDTDDSGT